MRWFGVCTLFPQSFASLTGEGVIGRAIKQQLIDLQLFNLRDFSLNNRKRVDDRPFGGGPGMVIQVPPLLDCINYAKQQAQQYQLPTKVILLSPQGKQFNHHAAKIMANQEANLIFVCGRYEGIDERLIDLAIDEEWSIGDYVLTGGELGAMVMIDAIARLIPGVLGEQQSAEQDSFAQGLLDHPHYTRPPVFAGKEVPAVLLQGNHQQIALWRLEQALERTWLRRPELLKDLALTEQQQLLLQKIKAKLNN